MEITKPKEDDFLARAVEYPDIAELIKNKIVSEKNRNYACNSVWASEAAHDCMRYLVYQQCNWEDAKQAEDNLLLIFHEGNTQEDQLLLELQKAGIRVKNLQISIKIAEANITGKLDCIAEIANSKGEIGNLPIEIKSMSDVVYNSVNTVADLKKYPWTRKYYGQCQSYCKNDLWFFPECYLLAKNKSTGAIKLIKDFDGGNTIKYNEEYWNWMIERAKKVNEFVFNNKYLQMEIAKLKSTLQGKETKKEQNIKNKIVKLENKFQYPERIKYDLKVCKGCKYEHICIADLSDITTDIIENESVLKAIDEYLETKINKEKYKDADKAYTNALSCLKSIFPIKDTLYMTDKYLIRTKIRKLKDTEYLTFDIKDIDNTKT